MEEVAEGMALKGLRCLQVMVPVVHDLDHIGEAPEPFKGGEEGEIMEAEGRDPVHGEMVCHIGNKGYVSGRG